MIFLSVASKKSSSSGQSGGAMVANKDESQGNVTTNAKGWCSNNILTYELIRKYSIFKKQNPFKLYFRNF